MHTDEAVNAVIVATGLEGQGYHYDPQDRHGPSLFYLTVPLCRVLGVRSLADMEAWHLRLGIALVSAATVFPIGLILAETPGAALAAAGLFAIGAPFLFYGRYALHEPILVFATLVLVGGAWRFWTTGKTAWAVLAGLAAGLAQCTKETAALGFIAAALALGLCSLHRPTRAAFACCRAPSLFGPAFGRAALVAGLAALLVVLAGYSSLGSHWTGLVDAVRAVPLQMARAGGAGHDKPWSAYLAWILRPTPLSMPWFGWTVLGLSCAGLAASLSSHAAPLIRFLAALGLTTLVLYSAIPYKTPWLMLNALAPLVPVAGYGAWHLWSVCRSGRTTRSLAPLAAALAVGLSLRESYRLCFAYTDEPHNPFAYSPTSPDLRRLAARIEALSLPGDDPVVYVASRDYWPLPWYLRKRTHVGFWDRLPSTLGCDLLLTSPDLAQDAEARLGPGWHREYFGLRADVLIFLYHR